MTATTQRLDAVLVYDADCGFCTRFASWVGPAIPWQEIDLDAAGTTEAEMTTAAGWLVDGRVTDMGAGAIAAALVQRGGIFAAAGRAIRLPVVRLLAAVVYRAVARNRHRMPGGTPACKLPDRATGPSRLVLVTAMVAIALVGLGSLAYANTHREPYPALLMPGFGYVPDDGHQTSASEVTYAARLTDGRVVVVAPSRLIPSAGPAAYVMAQRLLAAPSAQSAEVMRWIAEQLDRWPSTRGATALVVTHHGLTYDSASHAVTDDTVSSRTVLDLRGSR